MENKLAFGHPGSSPKWNSSAKTGVGTALNKDSEVWFTLSHGILNEIYFPRVDIACVRDMGFLIADGAAFFSEEKRHTNSVLTHEQDGIPCFNITNTCQRAYYKTTKNIIADPKRNCILQKINLEILRGSATDYKMYALLAPHINNAGWGNTAWVHEGVLYAQRGDVTLAMMASVPFSACSVGYVGQSDAWQDVSQHKKMEWHFTHAHDGNVAICGEIDMSKTLDFELVIAFAYSPEEALEIAKQSLSDGFTTLKKQYTAEWANWQKLLSAPKMPKNTPAKLWKTSLASIRAHEASQFEGGYIASLSIPWGFSKGDDDMGGYHLVWPRDLVETAGSLLAANAFTEALTVLNFLQKTQLPDGHWSQNMWLNGTPYWGGVQLDETAFPILLLGMLFESKAVTQKDLARFQDMVWRAASYLVKNGPCSQQDRWEENSGYSPFTVAAEISALLTAADLLALMDTSTDSERQAAHKNHQQYLRETADSWNDSIERWCYVENTELAHEVGVEGYYVRIAPSNVGDTETLNDDVILIKNLPYASETAAKNVISPDALALVRFGLRDANDPRMVDTVKVIDAKLKVTTPSGDCWYRYNNDGYGEHADGQPFDGTGVGRLWPLMTGERAHYEIAKGDFDRATELLNHFTAFANDGGMLPEQIWDTEDIPERELFFGRPSGSAMPLVWAHGEYVKLCRSLQDKAIFDMPSASKKRYLMDKTVATHALWRFDDAVKTIEKGKILRIEAEKPFTLHWSAFNWNIVKDTESTPSVFGTYFVAIAVNDFKESNKIVFTFLWTETNTWEGRDFEVAFKK
jgi:glucoamylase